jgi:hypothetical protein
LHGVVFRKIERLSGRNAKGESTSIRIDWGVKFIDENGGGPGVRLKKRQQMRKM